MLKTKNILIPYFFAVIIALFISLPLYHDFLNERVILSKEKEELEREDIYVEAIRTAERELVPYVPILEELKRGLPSSSSVPSVIRYLEKTVSDSGLQLDNISSYTTAEMAERPHMRETIIEMAVVGNNYSSLKSFIEELERSIKIIIIENATISLTTEDEEIRFALSLSIKTYSY